MKVKFTRQVTDGATVYNPGDVATISADTGKAYLECGWVEEADVNVNADPPPDEKPKRRRGGKRGK